MSTYFTSDIHGCYKELRLILKNLSFDSKKDYLWVAGDLVSRGPDSLKVLRYLYSLQNSVEIVLGNHDINLIAVYSGIKKNKKENYFDEFLEAPDSAKLIDWLRSQSILKIDKKRKIIMSHAGISPQWNMNTARKCATEIREFLSYNYYSLFLESMYNNQINFWELNLNRLDRLRFAVNTFTRMRYCYPDGTLDMSYKDSPNFIKYPLLPWFLLSSQIPKDYSIFFGHWSSLKDFHVPKPFFSLDSGCCWGEELTVLRWEDKKKFFQPFLKK